MSKENSIKIRQQIITDATAHMRKTQYAINADQIELLNKIKLVAENNGDFDFNKIVDSILKKIKSEIENVEKFNNFIIGYSVHYGIKTNKLKEALEGAREIAIEENISQILKGTLTGPLDNGISKTLPVLGKEEFWGTSKPTFLTTLLKIIHNVLDDDVPENNNSAIFHTFNCSDNFDSSGVVTSLFINNNNSIKVTIPHSGYSFGGDRMNKKIFRPQDCTSFLEMSAQLTANGASTHDLYLAKRYNLNQDITKIIHSSNWLNSEGGSMVRLFDVNETAPKPGDICVVRKFNRDKPIESSAGFGGHAGIYIGTEEKQNINLAYNRNMPQTEGFGLEYKNDSNNDNSENQQIDRFFLTRNDNDFNFNKGQYIYPFNELSDLTSLVEFVDNKLLNTSIPLSGEEKGGEE